MKEAAKDGRSALFVVVGSFLSIVSAEYAQGSFQLGQAEVADLPAHAFLPFRPSRMQLKINTPRWDGLRSNLYLGVTQVLDGEHQYFLSGGDACTRLFRASNRQLVLLTSERTVPFVSGSFKLSLASNDTTRLRHFLVDRCNSTYGRSVVVHSDTRPFDYEVQYIQEKQRDGHLSAEKSLAWPLVVVTVLCSLTAYLWGIVESFREHLHYSQTHVYDEHVSDLDFEKGSFYRRGRCDGLTRFMFLMMIIDARVLVPGFQFFHTLVCLLRIRELAGTPDVGSSVLSMALWVTAALTSVSAPLLLIADVFLQAGGKPFHTQIEQWSPLRRRMVCGSCLMGVALAVVSYDSLAGPQWKPPAQFILAQLIALAVLIASCWQWLKCKGGRRCSINLSLLNIWVLLVVASARPIATAAASCVAPHLRLLVFLALSCCLQLAPVVLLHTQKLALTIAMLLWVSHLSSPLFMEGFPHSSAVLLPTKMPSSCDYLKFPLLLFDGNRSNHADYVLQHRAFQNRTVLWTSPKITAMCTSMVSSLREKAHPAYPSTGCVAFFAATQLCQQVSLYGFGPDSQRDEPDNANETKAVYSIRGDKGREEFTGFHDFAAEHAIMNGMAAALNKSDYFKLWENLILDRNESAWKFSSREFSRALACTEVKYPGPLMKLNEGHREPCGHARSLLTIFEKRKGQCADLARASLGGRAGWAALGPGSGKFAACDVYEKCQACEAAASNGSSVCRVGPWTLHRVSAASLRHKSDRREVLEKKRCDEPSSQDAFERLVLPSMVSKHQLEYAKQHSMQAGPDAIMPKLGSGPRWRSCAIVGGGSNMLGQEVGAAIDAHDKVIRINDHAVREYDADLGSRVDIVVSNHHSWRNMC
eukprot:TRINITY_DN20172_c0_g2_i1.p1 TRINITY_DN20172_c0_g2~~TRINITY_DN20172_c0_g2_i1.p1  ORF type:complete len:870 (-),score=77.50 TRINITY_DN20172_c0_g2_i1:136-2745(-)